MKPLLLLDVDGVLCPFGGLNKLWMGEPQEGFAYHSLYNVYTSANIKRRIETLMDHFEIHWATGWEDEANEVISPLYRVPEFPVMPLVGMTYENVFNAPHWKYHSIMQYVKDRPFVFIDDDISDEMIQVGVERSIQGIPTLMLPVECSEGLTDRQVERAVEWATSLRSEDDCRPLGGRRATVEAQAQAEADGTSEVAGNELRGRTPVCRPAKASGMERLRTRGRRLSRP